ncbi:hypothetical protein TKK_0017854 [Trichogramma kaykai]
MDAENHTLEHFEARLQLLESYWEKAMQKHEALLPYENQLATKSYFKNDYYLSIEARYIENKALLPRRIKELRGGHAVVGTGKSTAEDTIMTLPSPRFCSLVRNKESIPRVAKLQHLLNAVQGPAALRLRGLEIVESNFDVAWDMLLWRYDNQNIRMFNALEHLIGLPRVKVRCAEDLTDLIDRSEEAVRSLTELQCLVKFYDIWIVHCVVRKLDANSRES